MLQQLLGGTVVQDRFVSYIDQLCVEIRKQARWNAEPLQTIFLGGGTPYGAGFPACLLIYMVWRTLVTARTSTGGIL